MLTRNAEKINRANRQFVQFAKRGYDSSSGLTDEWKEGYRKMHNGLKTIITELGGVNFESSRGHFGISGFFTYEEQVWYFSISDVRWFDGRMLIRTAKDYKDFSGGSNEYVNVRNKERRYGEFQRNMAEEIERLISNNYKIRLAKKQ